ncbi:MAG TPA: hypothetical protein VHQ90_22555 [Thermoanaerobaculia bacterium]|nr:hypothetical protein [Thermoanaerobaculia bacterium]
MPTGERRRGTSPAAGGAVAAIRFENRGGLLTVYLADWTALRGNPAGSSK